MIKIIFAACCITLLFACKQPQTYSTIIKNGNIYDGNGGEPFKADIGINGDTIAFIGDLENTNADEIIDASGMAVAPGFINMLSWATESLIADGRSLSDIRQGVTLEVMGEGWSMGPLDERLTKELVAGQGDIKYDVKWNTLGSYLGYLEKKGISCNVASFVGATTVRQFIIGEENRAPTKAELDRMKMLVKQAMEEGAMGVGSSLIYPPAFFAKTNELVELCKVASAYGGTYISHIRSEGNNLMEALEELITIAKEANIHAEIYHLKAAGINNWYKMDSVIRRIESARNEGIDITADMYTYLAAATDLTASFPPYLQDGGFLKLWQRLHNPVVRFQMKKAMNTNASDWENLYNLAGGADNVLLLGFIKDSLKKFNGKTLAEVATIRGASPEQTAMELIIEDSSRISAAYFLMSEENLQKQIALPWVSFGSDEGSYANEGVFLKSKVHPRAYGNFSRVLGKYCRDEKLISLPEAIFKLSNLPATNLKLKKRGELKPGYYADIVVFDPEKVTDNATYDEPHQYASGMLHVFVNGVAVLKNGTHTGLFPGKFIKGPGYKP